MFPKKALRFKNLTTTIYSRDIKNKKTAIFQWQPDKMFKHYQSCAFS